MNKQARIKQLELRLDRLNMNASENGNIIRKVKRQLRKLNNE